MPRDINSWWQPYCIFSKWPPPKMKEFILFHIFLSTWNILMVLVSSVMGFFLLFFFFFFFFFWGGGKGIWIWCSADNNISSWWIVLRSGSKIRLKKFNFQSDFLLSNHISATANLWKCFLEIIIHMDAYYKEYHILFVTMASTLDYQDGQSWYVWQKMPSLTAVNVSFFLGDIPHLNYQQNIR